MKFHFWLMGFGVAVLAANYFYDLFQLGGVGLGLGFGAIGLGIRQWFMASAHAERQAGAFSGNYAPQKDKLHYHGPDWD